MAIPRYDELPMLPESNVRNAWQVWGRSDRLGTLNRITPETVLAALTAAVSGHRIHLSLPVDYFDPPLYGRSRTEHRVFDRNRNMVEDELAKLDPQASSQWDSLRHIRAGRHGHYAGLEADDPAVAELGIDQLTRLGLVMRGVLLDLPGWWREQGREVDALTEVAATAADLVACAQLQGAEVRPGDLLLIRTGWLDGYRRSGIPSEQLAMPASAGLEASEATARLLWDWGVCAVAADNPAVEVLPGDPAIGSLHRRLIAGLGMPLGELWDLDTLAGACRERSRYDVCVVSVPLHVPGGVASPANAMAII
jgi:kynurenine formamidase